MMRKQSTELVLAYTFPSAEVSVEVLSGMLQIDGAAFCQRAHMSIIDFTQSSVDLFGWVDLEIKRRRK